MKTNDYLRVIGDGIHLDMDYLLSTLEKIIKEDGFTVLLVNRLPKKTSSAIAELLRYKTLQPAIYGGCAKGMFLPTDGSNVEYYVLFSYENEPHPLQHSEDV